MKNRYILDPSSKKIHCPSCGEKRFVGMIDLKTGEFLNEYGRCDRELQCGFFERPKSNGFDNSVYEYEQITPKKVKPSFHEPRFLEESLMEGNNLLDYFSFLFGHLSSNIIQKSYLIGTSSDFKNGTVFWQIDDSYTIRGGKIICYKSDGKRTKDISWIHAIQKRKKEIIEFNLHQCLFGLHLIVNDKISTIALVESEKTACIMSVIFPQFLWMACGSKSEFKKEKLLPIISRKIVAYPDCEVDKNGISTFQIWNQKADKLNNEGFNITVSNLLEVQATSKQKIEGIDIADFFME